MKKFMSVFIAACMISAMSLTAFAADIDQDSDPKTGRTTIDFNVDPAYTVTIPATVEMAKVEHGGVVTYENDLTVFASDVRLKSGEKIQVTMSSDFKLTSTENAELDYTVKVDDTAIANNGVVAEFTTKTETQSAAMHFVANDPEYAGSYTDTVTFTLEVVNG